MPPRKTSSKLRDLFVNTPGTLSSSVDFMSNHHSKLAKELPKPNFLGGLQDVDEAHIPEPSPEDRGNAVLDAVKAFALATAINMTIAGVGIWSLKSYLGATDVSAFSLGVYSNIG